MQNTTQRIRDITQIVMRSVDSIHPYGNNPRKNDNAVAVVAKSIEKFGFKQPIVIDIHGEIVAGETRWKAAKQLGRLEVPCVLADDLTQEEVNAYRLADNKVAEYAEWDLEKLEIEIVALSDEFNMEELFNFCPETDQFALPAMDDHIDSFFESGVQTKEKTKPAETARKNAPNANYRLIISCIDYETMLLITDTCKSRGIAFDLEEI